MNSTPASGASRKTISSADSVTPSGSKIFRPGARCGTTNSSQGNLDATSPRDLADAIVASGLFPLPPGWDNSLTSSQATTPAAPPLDVAKKVSLIGTVFGQQGGSWPSSKIFPRRNRPYIVWENRSLQSAPCRLLKKTVSCSETENRKNDWTSPSCISCDRKRRLLRALRRFRIPRPQFHNDAS